MNEERLPTTIARFLYSLDISSEGEFTVNCRLGIVARRIMGMRSRLHINKETQDPFGTWGSLTLAMSYSRTTYRCTS
jgi:hypothetical protein